MRICPGSKVLLGYLVIAKVSITLLGKDIPAG
jgi:hypothetical protein